jgi:hypothetical protein
LCGRFGVKATEEVFGGPPRRYAIDWLACNAFNVEAQERMLSGWHDI